MQILFASSGVKLGVRCNNRKGGLKWHDRCYVRGCEAIFTKGIEETIEGLTK